MNERLCVNNVWLVFIIYLHQLLQCDLEDVFSAGRMYCAYAGRVTYGDCKHNNVGKGVNVA